MDRSPEQPPSPTTGDQRIAAIIDAATAVGNSSVRFALGRFEREGAQSGDLELIATIRVEGTAFKAFHDGRAFEHWQPRLRRTLFSEDLPYLRSRAVATPNRVARARYLHAIATITRRADDGAAAANAYLDVVVHFREPGAVSEAEALNTLLDTFPLALVTSRRYGTRDRFKIEATAFLTDNRPTFAHGKARVFQLVVADTAVFRREDLLPLRDASIALLGEIAGGDDAEISAVGDAGRRLANRIGEAERPWLEAEAAALEQKLAYASHPLLVETVGARLLHLYRRLGDDERARATIERTRAARAAQEYQEFSAQPEGWEEEIERLRVETQRIIRDDGPLAVLNLCATSQNLLPVVATVTAEIAEMREQGIGIWRQFASTVVSSGERVIGYEHNEFDEQYEFSWLFVAVGRFGAIVGEGIVAGEINESHFVSVLQRSWMGREENISYGADMPMPNDLIRLMLPALKLYVRVSRGDADRDLMIPALDSLVLRMEAVLRKLARLLGRPDIYADRDGIQQVLGLRALLDDAAIVEKCGEDLIAFAKFTLMREPEGLRDRIGHAILHLAEYRIFHFDAVMLLILRLSALDLPTIDSTGDNS